ncbi:hypothetical protein AZC_0516 [Azorhizobium caulinodans ORS 571]|uniref:DUF1330 domain-containing protein n=1 Tax=Azorhizobium caulinodans (strain ATCC 43989 / DSM 5975 / JCM 20966 / LMG 6465 / NBRC 14845 / NCIMB 13405 / ORS 571) TaxID=438753 RepID=A8IMA2_AZOC5|nr:DUF1330 domain-containing protein [Azorhizobium caulinodans]BAF86514.1 hypothetical protein AZC_0516 [Azorhizobium caulinodans ORS 571]
MSQAYLAPTEAAGRRFFSRDRQRPVMLNLLRFRTVADYSDAPDLAPATPISGAEAYALYVAHTLPLLQASGGAILWRGRADAFLIGPEEEMWDEVLLVQQASAAALLAMANGPAYRKVMGHRTAALADSRLLPLTELPLPG